MALSKKQRAELHAKYGGCCAYCGTHLTNKWHADHVKPVLRESVYQRGKGFVATGVMHQPHNDHLANMMPACVPCNIDKHAMDLETWRKKLQASAETLYRNYSTYRHARRFELITEASPKVVFYFERYLPKRPVK